MSGGSCSLEIVPSDVVICYEEVIPAVPSEDGMSDRGAYLYFVAKKEGTAQVSITFYYPTCEDEKQEFTLRVDKDLNVSRADDIV